MPPKEQAETLKNEGGEVVVDRCFQQAIARDEEAVGIDDPQPAYWSKMATWYEELCDYERMADASRACIRADRNFVKGYFQLAVALQELLKPGECLQVLETGLAIEASNVDLIRMKKRILDLQRENQVANYCEKANKQFWVGNVSTAMKTIEEAHRLDPNNPYVEKLMNKIKSAYSSTRR